MKILISTTQIPFIHGGAEDHAENLMKQLQIRGHEVEMLKIPLFDSPLERVEDYIVAARLMDMSYANCGKIDLCIGLKFPAYLVPHDNKKVWILHQYRQVYDLFGTKFGVPDVKAGRRIRDIVTTADTRYLSEAKGLFANSKNVAKRLKKHNALDAVPLYHPCPDIEKFYVGNYEDYILMPSRITRVKRQLLALEALALTKNNMKLVLLGKADTDEETNALKMKIKELKLDDKVIITGFVTLEEKLKLYSNARAVLFIPYDEDYGYITLEAMAANKMVITATDSGGPLEFVLNNETGIITEPNPKEIAQAMDAVIESEKMAKQFGQDGNKRLIDMNITWDAVVEALIK